MLCDPSIWRLHWACDTIFFHSRGRQGTRRLRQKPLKNERRWGYLLVGLKMAELLPRLKLCFVRDSVVGAGEGAPVMAGGAVVSINLSSFSLFASGVGASDGLVYCKGRLIKSRAWDRQRRKGGVGLLRTERTRSRLPERRRPPRRRAACFFDRCKCMIAPDHLAWSTGTTPSNI